MGKLYHSAQSYVCSVCATEKPASEFRTKKPEPICKECKQKRSQERKREYNRRFYRSHPAPSPEEIRERNRKNYLKHREKRLARSRQNYWENHEQNKARQRAYAAEHKDQMAQRQREWASANRLKVNERMRRGYAYKWQSDVDVVSYDRVLERDGYHCYICEKAIDPTLKSPHPGSLTFDHVIPFVRGGVHSEDNIKPAHRVCNNRKHMMLLEWMSPRQRRGPSVDS